MKCQYCNNQAAGYTKGWKLICRECSEFYRYPIVRSVFRRVVDNHNVVAEIERLKNEDKSSG